VVLKLENKKEIVKEVAGVAAQATSAAISYYRGLTVGQMTELRAKARASDVYLRVVRNTLARLAVKNTAFECLAESLTGPVILAFSRKEPNAAARLLRDFSKTYEKLEVKFLALDSKLYGSDQLEFIAKLPTKEEAISQFMSVLLAPMSKLVRTLDAVRVQKETAAA
jgi:large subunit ribosomal protein L10